MNFSKTLDSLNRTLLIEKPKAYSLDLNAASLIKSCLTKRYQHCKIGNSFSTWERIIAGVPQESIFGSLFFNIFINGIFLYFENLGLCNYADNSTVYASGESLSINIEYSKADFLRISTCFHENLMVLHSDKYHFMILGDSNCTCNFAKKKNF